MNSKKKIREFVLLEKSTPRKIIFRQVTMHGNENIKIHLAKLPTTPILNRDNNELLNDDFFFFFFRKSCQTFHFD